VSYSASDPELIREALPVTDWRGTPIYPGALVIHGATSGYSVVITEAHVAAEPFTRTGKVRLDVIRRSGGAWRAASVIAVEPRHLTVIEALPASRSATNADLRRALQEATRRAL
jgi:hypothetical protein